MSIEMLSYLVQFIPILIGIVMLLALKSFKHSGNKILVEANTDIKNISEICADADGGLQAMQENCGMEIEAVFKSYVIDESVINGFLLNTDKQQTKHLHKLALEKFGLLMSQDIGMLLNERKLPKRMRLFAKEGDFEKLAYLFTPASGIILSYILSGDLELIEYE
jgi:hypothetical protein